MSDETRLILLLAAMHVVALAAAAGLLLLVLRTGEIDGPPQQGDGDGGDGGGRVRPRGPIGRPPLPDAAPARVRLRGSARLADSLPGSRRRQPREPPRPARRAVDDGRSSAETRPRSMR